jgi:2-amino-4-hydroxy-6-hydroxymethyldihydropteridine diphosphokinase
MTLQYSRVALALGSNIEPRFDCLQQAVNQLAKLETIVDLRVARVYVAQAQPVPGVDVAPGSEYLNTAVTFRTTLDPLTLLERVKQIETSLGRDTKLHPHGASRPIDCDVILHGQSIVTHPRLTLPHPRMLDRVFVLQPLCDLLPFAPIPGDGRTLRAALERLLIEQRKPLLQPYLASLTMPS